MAKKVVPFSHILGYSLGDGAFSLTMNTIWGFAMLFYTQALGIDPESTGWILAIPMIWDAISDPIMGRITDNTRSRFGRRHPHIVAGGLLMASFYVFLWYVPDVFRTTEREIIIYLIVVNLISRTLFTWYYVPYVALGFEVCQEYNDRSRLQSARWVMNMAFNLLFCGILVWRVFLVDSQGNRDTTITANYAQMALWFGAAIMLLIFLTAFSTRAYATDTRGEKKLQGNSVSAFFKDMIEICRDKYGSFVLLFFCVIQGSFVFVSAIQMYVYVSFMRFSPTEASFVHGSTMVGFALGSIAVVGLSKKWDKKPAVYIGAFINILANVILACVFLTGLLKPQMIPMGSTSLATGVFWFCNTMYWFGNGISVPMVYSMMADVSEINRIETGYVKNGSYSAVLSFLMKASSALALIGVGKILVQVGFVEGSDTQTPEVALRLARMMFFLGIVFTAIAVIFIVRYPVNREFMRNVKGPEERTVEE